MGRRRSIFSGLVPLPFFCRRPPKKDGGRSFRGAVPPIGFCGGARLPSSQSNSTTFWSFLTRRSVFEMSETTFTDFCRLQKPDGNFFGSDGISSSCPKTEKKAEERLEEDRSLDNPDPSFRTLVFDVSRGRRLPVSATKREEQNVEVL
ncbi:unnamed protein product [Bursaphelenchus xylophilus]|uniref:(pine wood nematode) hypothetical protein n=1 Tax=Bursaphelenchus xylophilus TaxID=6326 RepID=A0A1I7RHN8_BURXY|nr:unnamed protein product [Bursaphelenchus xylophilus]CAG9115547.1 unnamed protein product [Bursaphelenchus xylophilus]